ncbi:hypothetical protein HGRIS_002640 [Hohenbuehelia grisea]|uniref:Uncharacterized protein n=1 Tax=Hohenbuehelia grisea TaxID=104357 RepID=A0ABR3JLS2_9AGAR
MNATESNLLRSSSSAPSNLSRTLPPHISASASFQSHLSTTHAQQRQRSSSSHLFPPRKRSELGSNPSGAGTRLLALTSTSVDSFGRSLFSAQNLLRFMDPRGSKSWSSLCFKWILLIYYAISAVYATSLFYRTVSDRKFGSRGRGDADYFRDLSQRTKLSRLLSVQSPIPDAFEPYILRAHAGSDNLQALSMCIWFSDSEGIERFFRWVGDWPGYVSAVVTTTAEPSSSAHTELLHTIRGLASPNLLGTLSLHVLHSDLKKPESPNGYLNLARLFAPTDRVVLFPGNLSMLPSPDFNHYVSGTNYAADTTLLVTSGQPSGSLGPVITDINNHIWCTDRFMFLTSRQALWDECLWQFRLGNHGQMRTIDVPPFRVPTLPRINSRIYKRLSTRYRAEACDQTLKELSTSGVPDTVREAHIQWVQDYCQMTAGWMKE